MNFRRRASVHDWDQCEMKNRRGEFTTRLGQLTGVGHPELKSLTGDGQKFYAGVPLTHHEKRAGNWAFTSGGEGGGSQRKTFTVKECKDRSHEELRPPAESFSSKYSTKSSNETQRKSAWGKRHLKVGVSEEHPVKTYGERNGNLLEWNKGQGIIEC